MKTEILAQCFDELNISYTDDILCYVIDALNAYEDSSDPRYQTLGEQKFCVCKECEKLKKQLNTIKSESSIYKSAIEQKSGYITEIYCGRIKYLSPLR